MGRDNPNEMWVGLGPSLKHKLISWPTRGAIAFEVHPLGRVLPCQDWVVTGEVPFYAAAQLTGAISAAFTLRVLLHPIKHLGITSPSGTDIQALIMELVVTFSMMFIASAVATDTKAIGELAGIAVGSAVCITSILAGPVSGGSMNLARTIGPAIASGYYKGVWVYVLGPVCGTLQGAWSYNLIRVTNKPVQAILPASFSFKLHRMRSDNEQVTANDPLNVL
ncbi:hypothetical protein TEA_000878 [Camellia sinensis var. sinensis]|uniref:Uncharacterized protein n=1 Tax=Camellia sinensis var. sinensis TaxID=542762 RepID=A0A4S4F2X0_CAMSN|nr:hypothetical protein TEA_000878 [Camellia sinensis var. sinensis]